MDSSSELSDQVFDMLEDIYSTSGYCDFAFSKVDTGTLSTSPASASSFSPSSSPPQMHSLPPTLSTPSPLAPRKRNRSFFPSCMRPSPQDEDPIDDSQSISDDEKDVPQPAETLSTSSIPPECYSNEQLNLSLLRIFSPPLFKLFVKYCEQHYILDTIRCWESISSLLEEKREVSDLQTKLHELHILYFDPASSHSIGAPELESFMKEISTNISPDLGKKLAILRGLIQTEALQDHFLAWQSVTFS